LEAAGLTTLSGSLLCQHTAIEIAGGTKLDSWRIELLPITHPDAARLVEEVQLEYVARYGGRDQTPLLPGYFDLPSGSFFVGYLQDVPTATGAWRRRSDVEALGSRATAEIKRMYVAPGGRRRGLARAVLAHLELTAAAAGAEVMILETGTAQPEALELYASAGYQPIPGFGLYRDSPLNRCLARVLTAD
jgi:GNAT superfamily N-acetyltransferase